MAVISCTLGASAPIAFVILTCRIVRGIIKSRVAKVKTMMLNPRLLKQTQYNSTRLFIIGLLMMRSQRSPMSSTSPPSLSVRSSLA